MGWVHDEAGFADQHEGYAAQVTADGRSTATTTGRGALFPRAEAAVAVAAAQAEHRIPYNDEMYDLVPWDELLGWQATCSCGWTGSTWRRDATIPGEYEGRDADDASLADGRTVADAVLAEWEAHLAPLSRVAAVAAAAERAAAARAELDDAVRAAREAHPPATWAEIGQAVHMSRQAAHERWKYLDPKGAGDDRAGSA